MAVGSEVTHGKTLRRKASQEEPKAACPCASLSRGSSSSIQKTRGTRTLALPGLACAAQSENLSSTGPRKYKKWKMYVGVGYDPCLTLAEVSKFCQCRSLN